MADLLEAFEALSYFGSFWRFVASASHRERSLQRWRDARGRERGWLAAEASVCTLCGVGPLVLVYYLLAT